MQKVRVFLLLMVLCWFSGQGLLYAQEDYEEDEDSSEGDIAIETDWDGYVTELYSRGDQTFTISLGVIFPTVFHDRDSVIKSNWFPVGGVGTLVYNHFLNAHLFVGIEVGINFNSTVGKNTIFIVPVGLRAGWQFVLQRFEFAMSFTLGIAPERYLNNSYFGMFMKVGASGYFRFSPEWSFGLSTDWNWYPQWPTENGIRVPAKDIYANIIGVTLAARYHF